MGLISKLFGHTEPTNQERFDSLTGSIENVFRVIKVAIDKVDSEYYIINNYAGQLPSDFADIRVKISNKMPEFVNDYDLFINGCKSSVIAKINIIRNRSNDHTLYSRLEQIINSI